MSTENIRQTVELIAMALSEDGGYEYYHVNDMLKELAKDVADMQAENAKLKQELEAVGTAAYLYGRNDLADENAKLLELLQDYHRYEHDDCYSCRYINECRADESGRCIAPMRLGERYRELGVEVSDV